MQPEQWEEIDAEAFKRLVAESKDDKDFRKKLKGLEAKEKAIR